METTMKTRKAAQAAAQTARETRWAVQAAAAEAAASAWAFWEENAPRIHAGSIDPALQSRAEEIFWSALADRGIARPTAPLPTENAINVGYTTIPAGTTAKAVVSGFAGLPVLYAFEGISTVNFETRYYRAPYGYGVYIAQNEYVLCGSR